MDIKERLKKISFFESLSFNPDTIDAFCEALGGEVKTFNTVEELMKDLEDEEG